MLTNRTHLAKTSAKPGKTQLINHFLINNQWYLVDLPGYGWAQASKTDKAQWKKMIEDYLINRQNLMNVFVLIDSRHEPQAVDIEFIEWLGMEEIPFAMVFTKTDKMKQGKLSANLAHYNKVLSQTWEELPPQFQTSAQQKSGRDEILHYIMEINRSVGM